MKVQLLSDLHLESNWGWQAVPAPDAQLLVLAGDIGSYQVGTRLSDINFGLTRFSPHYGWPCPVVFVPGNHEYDGLDFNQAHQMLQAACQRLGIIWLERQALVWPLHSGSGESIRLLGTTLWSDFDALAKSSAPHNLAKPAQPKAREKAFKAANYYLRKTGTHIRGSPMLAEQVREHALVCQQWLEAALRQPFDGKTVVITHFAPSLQSADPRYGLTPGTAGFCNNLDHLMPLATCWLHGHLHTPQHYRHQGCLVVANPLGYASKGEQAHFDPLMCINI